VACYLCAYKRRDNPKREDSLPAGSTAPDELGACWKCNVFACFQHGTRYGRFECAICTPALAVATVLTQPTGAASNAPVALMRSVGTFASGPLLAGVGNALQRIIYDHREAGRGDSRELVGPSQNLVADLAGVVAAMTDRFTAGIPGAGERFSRSELDAVAAEVRGQLRSLELRGEVDDDMVAVAAGALATSHYVADDVAPRELAEPRPPWDVEYPGLIDPIMWLVGTAYHVVTR
jgi:hypothetical protein